MLLSYMYTCYYCRCLHVIIVHVYMLFHTCMHVIIIVLVYMLLLYMSTCRPQDTHKEDNATDQADLNLVYWSNEGVLL